jgi:hypothetical protein
MKPNTDTEKATACQKAPTHTHCKRCGIEKPLNQIYGGGNCWSCNQPDVFKKRPAKPDWIAKPGLLAFEQKVDENSFSPNQETPNMKTDTQTQPDKAQHSPEELGHGFLPSVSATLESPENELLFGTGKTGFVDYPYVWQYELEQLQRQLEQKQAQADKLAEELRKLIEITPYSGTISAREALTAYESEVQR